MMTLEEAIKHCKDVALSCTNKECALEHFQLLKWLQEYSNMLEKQGEQKPIDNVERTDEYKGLTDFERILADICIGWIGKEIGWKQYIKDNADVLLKIAVEKFNSVQDVPFEQKPIDKVEPKFHEGEWIIHHGTENIYQVVARIDNQYQLKYGDNYTVQKCADVDRCARLWTIQDAKDGDVLVLNDEVFIYAHRKQLYSIAVAHCFVDSAGGFHLDGEFGHIEKGNSIHPATKEQRTILFQKMKEAGYEWDAEKKELKQIMQKHIANIKLKFHADDWVVNNTTRNVLHILKVENGQYVCDDCSFPITKENEYHLWTIKDAKDGDILMSYSDQPFIYNGNYNDFNVGAYGGVDCFGFGFLVSDDDWTDNKGIYPATKGQQDVLFAKMTIAGYTWNAEKKELKEFEF